MKNVQIVENDEGKELSVSEELKSLLNVTNTR